MHKLLYDFCNTAETPHGNIHLANEKQMNIHLSRDPLLFTSGIVKWEKMLSEYIFTELHVKLVHKRMVLKPFKFKLKNMFNARHVF